MFPSLRASPLGLPVARGLCLLLRFAQVSLEAHSAVRVFPAYAGRPKSLTGFPRAVLWTGTVLLTIAHNLFATAFINSPFFKGNVLAVTRSFHHPQMVITEDMFPQGTGSDGAHCPAPLDEAP